MASPSFFLSPPASLYVGVFSFEKETLLQRTEFRTHHKRKGLKRFACVSVFFPSGRWLVVMPETMKSRHSAELGLSISHDRVLPGTLKTGQLMKVRVRDGTTHARIKAPPVVQIKIHHSVVKTGYPESRQQARERRLAVKSVYLET